jgi:hypothetical protein
MFSAKNIFREYNFFENIFRRKLFYVERNGTLAKNVTHKYNKRKYIISP